MAIIVSNIRIGIDDPDMLAVEKAKRKLSVEDPWLQAAYCCVFTGPSFEKESSHESAKLQTGSLSSRYPFKYSTLHPFSLQVRRCCARKIPV